MSPHIDLKYFFNALVVVQKSAILVPRFFEKRIIRIAPPKTFLEI